MNNLYINCKSLIMSKNYDLQDINKKLDIYLKKDKITKTQYDELKNMV